MKKTLLLLLTILILSVMHIHAQESDLPVLVIYSQENDLQYITSLTLQEDNVAINYVNASVLQGSDLQGIRLIILAASGELELSGALELDLQNFAQTSGNAIVVMTPDLGEFGGDLRDVLGVTNFDKVMPEENTTTWSIELTNDFGNYSSGAQFTHHGQVGLFETDKPILAQAIDSDLDGEEVDDIQFPVPLIVNASTSLSHIITIALGLEPEDGDDEKTEIVLNQVDDILTTFVRELIVETISIQVSVFQSTLTTGNPVETSTVPQTQNTPPTEDSLRDQQVKIPGLPSIDLLTLVLAGFIALITLLLLKITNFFDWLSRKGYTLLVFVVGAFYNIQDRTLDYNEVMYNQARVEIIDFLEHVGRYGAHLREIKSVTKLGSGSLLWHLQVLEDFNVIEKIKVDSYTVFVNSNFADLFDPSIKEVEFNLQSKYTLPLLDVLDSYQFGEEIDLTDIEISTGINRRTLRRLMKKFENNGLIQIIAGPSLKLQIADKELMAKIHKSIDLRHSYELPAPEVTVSQVD